MNWEQLSEINFGLILTERFPATLYRPEYFTAPYDEGVRLLQQKGATREDVAKIINSQYLSDASSSVHKFNGIGEYQNFDWVKALQQASRNFELAKKLDKVKKKLQENGDVDLLLLYGELSSYVSDEASGLSLLSDVNYTEYKPFKLTGYDPIDKVLGGIPTDGPIVIFGLSGAGKSTFLSRLVTSLLQKYPEDKGAVYTLEMPSAHWAWRTVDQMPEILKVKERLFISGSVKNIEELVAEVMAKKVNFVVLDDIDNIVNESSAGEYERVFRRVKEVCRFMGIPFFVIAQVTKEAEIDIAGNRTGKDGKKLGGRFPRRTDLAWSSSAWKSAALLLAIHTVWDGLDMGENVYPKEEGQALDYIIALKSRDGWMGNRDPKYQVGPGAVVLEHTSNWTGKFYQGRAKLWGGRKVYQTIGEE